MSFDNAYQSLADVHDDSRWAFGTGFRDPLAGIDTTVPSTVDGADLGLYCLMLGDDALLLSHRLQQWCTHAPELEDEVAIANIALDLLGQARLLLSRAGSADGSGRGEDEFAFFRDEAEFRNVRLAEREPADFAELVVTVLIFATWRLEMFTTLAGSAEPVLAAIADKATKELAYHRDYAAGWVVRLGDGTPLSRSKTAAALQQVWPYVAELFAGHPVEQRLAGVAVATPSLRARVDTVLDEVLRAATLTRPDPAQPQSLEAGSGRDGVHSPQLQTVLAELQGLARENPGASW